MITPLQLLSVRQMAISLSKGIGTGLIWFASVVLDEHTLIPVGSALAVGLVIWRSSAVIQRFRDKVETLERDLNQMRKDMRRQRDD